MHYLDYHQLTKHSYNSVRMNPNRIDWNNQPSHFKFYKYSYKRLKLDPQIKEHKLIILAASLSAKKTYPNAEYYLRVNPSAGALYPNELYFQSKNNKNFEDGIYHYEVYTNSCTLLATLKKDGLEGYFNLQEEDGFIFLISNVYYRSSWKYKNRALRYTLLDAGHLLGALEFSAYIFEKEYKILYDFDKKALNELFSFTKEEFFTSAFCISTSTNKEIKIFSKKIPFQDIEYTLEENTYVENTYEDSIKITKKIENTKSNDFFLNKDFLEEIILKRRSIREFSNQVISKSDFETILEFLNKEIRSDCDEDIEIYCVINRVKDMHLGLYKDKTYIKTGDFKEQAAFLCLEQDLGRSSAVTFFLSSKSKNYQSMYQKAGIIGHRLYIISSYLNIQCTGIGAYYDDDVNKFLENDSLILYALAIGN